MPDIDVDKVARIAYEANRGYSLSLGDYLPPWDSASAEARDSSARGVAFLIGQPEASPSSQHEAWMQTRLAAGWQWGPIRDDSRKVHPALLEYDRLPQADRAKDFIFQAIVRAMIPHDADATDPAADADAEEVEKPHDGE
jgi:hypothetical protein